MGVLVISKIARMDYTYTCSPFLIVLLFFFFFLDLEFYFVLFSMLSFNIGIVVLLGEDVAAPYIQSTYSVMKG